MTLRTKKVAEPVFQEVIDKNERKLLLRKCREEYEYVPITVQKEAIKEVSLYANKEYCRPRTLEEMRKRYYVEPEDDEEWYDYKKNRKEMRRFKRKHPQPKKLMVILSSF